MVLSSTAAVMNDNVIKHTFAVKSQLLEMGVTYVYNRLTSSYEGKNTSA